MKPLLKTEWRKLAFANYLVPPELLEKHLPPHVELDFFNGSCILSLLGLQFRNSRVGGIKVPAYTDFAEVNLRFYVRHFDGNQWRKGIVILSEITDKELLRLLANNVFHQHYRSMPTRSEIRESKDLIDITYSWEFQKQWQHLQVKSQKVASPIPENSESEFVMMRPWSYTKERTGKTGELQISHAEWHTYPVEEVSISVDFAKVFGAEFSILSGKTPHSTILAEGSAVSVVARRSIG